MKRNKKKKIISILISLLVVLLMVAPINVAAAGSIVNVYGSYGYWSKYKPAFEYSDDVSFSWWDTETYFTANPNSNINMLFSANIPYELQGASYRNGYYDTYGVYLTGMQTNVSFEMALTFHLRLSYPMIVQPGERIEFYYIVTENFFVKENDNTPIYYNRPQNANLSYVDENGVTQPTELVSSIETAQNSDGYWVARVLCENITEKTVVANTYTFSYLTDSQIEIPYHGVARFGMVLSPVVSVVADPTLYPDLDEIENILNDIQASLDKEVNVDLPDYSLIIGDSNDVLEDLDEESAIQKFGDLMNNFAGGAARLEMVNGNTIFQYVLMVLLSDSFVFFMATFSCCIIITRVLLGR